MKALLSLLLLTASAAQATPYIEAQWLLRGSQALEQIKQAGPNGHPSKIKDPIQRLEMMLESAYAMHSARPELVHNLAANGGDEFHLTLVAGSEQLFSLAYLYKADGSLNGARLQALPKGWTILFSTDAMQASLVGLMEKRRAASGTSDLAPPRPLLVNTNDGMLVFDLVDPLHAFVYERELNLAPGGGQGAPSKGRQKVKAPEAGAAPPKNGP